MKKRHRKLYYLLTCLLLISVSCTKKTYTSDVFIKKQWQIFMSATYTIPANAGRTDHAVATMYLTDDNQLYYDVYFDANLGSGDTPSAVKLYTGTAAENGALLIDLHNGAFSGGEVKGNVAVDATMANKLINGTDMYMQVASSQIAAGLVRGQIDKKVVAAYDIDLAKYSNTVSTTATGKAYIRILSDNTLSTQVVVNNLPAGDALTTAHIHKTTDNSTAVTLASTAADFNKAVTTTVTAALAASLTTDNLYVDVHSTLYPTGLLKGIIR